MHIKSRSERAKWLKADPFRPGKFEFRPNIFAQLIDMCVRMRRARAGQPSVAPAVRVAAFHARQRCTEKASRAANHLARVQRSSEIKKRAAEKAALVKPVFV